MEFVCFREKSQEVEVTVYTVICLPNINAYVRSSNVYSTKESSFSGRIVK